MSIWQRLMGNAAAANLPEIQREYAKLLGEGETIEGAYQLVRELFLFTNKRLILVDRQGLTGKKVEYLSIPYRHIHRFAIETAGHFDLDAELKIWVAGEALPIVKRFDRRTDIYAVQAVLATYALR